MGQYHLTVNLDKREFISPHKLGAGLKLWEQLANEIGPGKALVILLAHPDQRGGGDFDVDENWHGPERVDMSKIGEMPEEYPAIAKRTIGRWRGDRIAIIGDYAVDGDIPGVEHISEIYGLCMGDDDGEYLADSIDCWTKNHPGVTHPGFFKDVTADVCKVIEHELKGRFVGDGWRRLICADKLVFRWEGEGSDHKRVEGKITKLSDKLIEVMWPTGVKSYHGTTPKIDFF